MSEPSRPSFRPTLNKLFSNWVRGLIEERFSLGNMEMTKQEFQRDYAVPLDCKIYNYTQFETRNISTRYPDIFPAQVKQEIAEVNRQMQKGVTCVATAGLLYFGSGLLFKWAFKWGKLTASGLLPKFFAYSVLLNSTNYFVLVRNSDQIDVMMKHHIYYEQALDRYQKSH